MQALIASIAEGILVGLKRDGWLPADLSSCQRPNESVDSMLRRFAQERARNIVAGIYAEQELADEAVAA